MEIKDLGELDDLLTADAYKELIGAVKKAPSFTALLIL